MKAAEKTGKQPISRRKQKEDTRNRLLAAALELSEDRSLSSLSLRETAREAGVVPTAFYRHFDDVESLGLALVDQSLEKLWELVDSARTPTGSGLTGPEMAAALLAHVRDHRRHFRFLARERFGSLASLRLAIGRQLQRFTDDLAADLGRTPALSGQQSSRLDAVAALIMTIMIRAVEDFLEAPEDDPELERKILARTEVQFEVVAAGLRDAIRVGPGGTPQGP